MTRIHGTTKRQVRVMFEEEKPLLQQLPLTRFEYYRVGERTVHFDGFIEVDGAYYHAPPHYVGTRFVVHIGRLWIRIIDPRTQQLVREHAVTGKGQRHIVDAYLPKQTPVKVEQLAARIAGAGPGCQAFAQRSRNVARLRFGRCTGSSICCDVTKSAPSIRRTRLPRNPALGVSSSCALTSPTMQRH
jgi:hypothetical protein